MIRGLKLLCALAPLSVAATGCTREVPPAALAGLWSVGEMACADQRGLTFDAGVVTAHLEDRTMPLLEGVRYSVRQERGVTFVRIRHALPERPGGVSGAGGSGVVDLRLGADGWLQPVAQRFSDGLTGSVRMPLHDVGFASAMRVRNCDRPWQAAENSRLRGRGRSPG